MRRAEDGKPYDHEADGDMGTVAGPCDALTLAEVLCGCERVVDGRRLDEVLSVMDIAQGTHPCADAMRWRMGGTCGG